MDEFQTIQTRKLLWHFPCYENFNCPKIIPIGGEENSVTENLTKVAGFDFEAFENPGSRLQFGANWFINGHNAKIRI